MKRTKRKKEKDFKPSRDFINKAVSDYKKRGGKITKIIPSVVDIKDIPTVNQAEIDEFLLGN